LVEKLLDLFEIANHPDSFKIDLFGLDYKSSLFRVKDLMIETFPVNHTVRNLALKFRNDNVSIVYSSDTAYHEPLAEFASNCDVLIHEATMSTKLGDAFREGHSTPSDAARIAEKARVKQLFLVHVGFSVSENPQKAIEEARNFFDGIVVIPKDLEIYSF